MIELLLQAEGALSVGLLDRAETLYLQVERADPRNAIAVVGLSRVALERGRPQDALELARRALAIDPENVAAQRMVQRLEEVLAYRGETVVQVGHPVPEAATEGVVPGQVGHPVPEAATEGVVPGQVGHPGREAEPAAPPPPRRRSILDRLRRRD
jgi:tetratricopeptide (TPR) repeat protein